MTIQPPFSQRMRGAKPWIQNDWPTTARTALHHLLHDLVDKKYVEGWRTLDKEMRRIARIEPTYYGYEDEEAEGKAEALFKRDFPQMSWQHLFDFCERLYGFLAIPATQWGYNNIKEETVSLEKVREHIADELQRLFLEENFGYIFIKGEVRQRGRSHTRQQIAKVEPALGDPRLAQAREHYTKAMNYFEDSKKPDYENAVKEAVCAVEAAAKKLFPDVKAKTLDELIKKIQGLKEGQIPPTLGNTFIGLYSYRGSGEGVAHGGTGGGKVTKSFAEYVIAVAASQVILLHDIASSIIETDTPF